MTEYRSGSESIGNSIYKQLYSDIIYLKYAPGATLVEKEIASRMNVSKSPVHDAILRLVDQGLVEQVPGRKSPRVAEIHYADCISLMEIRRALEAHSAYYAARRITDDELEKLHGYLEQLRRGPDLSPKQYAQADANFHRQIVFASHNGYFIRAYSRIYGRILRYLLYVLEKGGITNAHEYTLHLPIYNAIVGHSAIMARDEMLETTDYMHEFLHLVAD